MILCLIVDFSNQQYGRAFLDVFCLGVNVYGIITWTKDDKAKRDKN